MGNTVKYGEGQKPWTIHRYPPTWVLGQYQREKQPATSAMASDEAKAILPSYRGCSSCIPLRLFKESSETTIWVGVGVHTGHPFYKHILYSNPWQFLQSLGWTVCLELGHSFQKPLAEEAENFLCSKLRQASKLDSPEGGLKPQEHNCTRKHTPAGKTGKAKGRIS